MCSTFKFRNVMGRNYDYELSYKEEVIFVPKNEKTCYNTFDVLGIGSGLYKDYPMLYDGMNEKGLCMSGLAFTGNAHYFGFDKGKFNVPVYKFIPYVLGNFSSVKEFLEELEDCLNLTDFQYDDGTPNADLHWFLCDKEQAVTIESTIDGLNIYENDFGVLTNNPPFPLMKRNIINELNILQEPVGEYVQGKYSTRGRETIGLSGDYTSMGRFERLAYLKPRLERQEKLSPIGDAFKLCSSVEQLYGVAPVGEKFEYTIYQAVYDMSKLKLYTRKYEDSYTKGYDFRIGDRTKIQRWEL